MTWTNEGRTETLKQTARLKQHRFARYAYYLLIECTFAACFLFSQQAQGFIFRHEVVAKSWHDLRNAAEQLERSRVICAILFSAQALPR
jgi:hypothetical protein